MMLIVYCDGAIEPKNPGGHAVGAWVLKNEQGQVLAKGARSCGKGPTMTNNIAEYTAVKFALEYIVSKGIYKECAILVRTDSELVVKQLNDEYQCKKDNLRRMRDEIWVLQEFLDCVVFEWIPREQNTEADEMSRSLYAIDGVCPDEHIDEYDYTRRDT